MNTTAYENETLELTIDELDAVNGGLLKALLNAMNGGSSAGSGSGSGSGVFVPPGNPGMPFPITVEPTMGGGGGSGSGCNTNHNGVYFN